MNSIQRQIEEEINAFGRVKNCTLQAALKDENGEVTWAGIHAALGYGILDGSLPEHFSQMTDIMFPRLVSRDSDTGPNGFEAAQYLAQYFVRLSNDPAGSEALINLRDRLAKFLPNCAPYAREALLLSFFEHVVPCPRYADFFRPWECDPILSEVLAEARRISPG